jgi:predicted nucleotidyltransferase
MIQVGPIELDERRLAELCRRYGVRELSLFGSAARGEARLDSDIDLLVEFLPEAEPGLLDHAGLMLDLEAVLGRKVDLVSKNALRPLLRDSILQDSRRLYAA